MNENNGSVKILPSMLSADYGALALEAQRCENAGADALHLDIMDGHFVPNISFGTDITPACRKACGIPLDAHLMLSRPDKYFQRFIDGGADAVSIHVEADCDIGKTLAAIKSAGARAGLVLKPATPPDSVVPYMDLFDYVLVMTVEPGYGGQKFMSNMLPKIEWLKNLSQSSKKNFPIMVDGGINLETAALAINAGATELVAGSFLFKADDMAREITALRQLRRDS